MITAKQIAIRAVVACLLCCVSGCDAASSSPGKTSSVASAEYVPQSGDVIFQSSRSTPLIEMIEGVSQSHYSHCGIVDRVDGQWVVYEAARQVEATPLDAFIDQGRDAGFAVYRFEASYRKYIPGILDKTRTYLGKPYDFRYRLDEDYIYCSELIYKAFEQTTGESLGVLIRLGDTDWKRFEDLILELESGAVPLDRMIITPIDLALAEQFEVVYARDFEVTDR